MILTSFNNKLTRYVIDFMQANIVASSKLSLSQNSRLRAQFQTLPLARRRVKTQSDKIVSVIFQPVLPLKLPSPPPPRAYCIQRTVIPPRHEHVPGARTAPVRSRRCQFDRLSGTLPTLNSADKIVCRDRETQFGKSVNMYTGRLENWPRPVPHKDEVSVEHEGTRYDAKNPRLKDRKWWDGMTFVCPNQGRVCNVKDVPRKRDVR